MDLPNAQRFRGLGRGHGGYRINSATAFFRALFLELSGVHKEVDNLRQGALDLAPGTVSKGNKKAPPF